MDWQPSTNGPSGTDQTERRPLEFSARHGLLGAAGPGNPGNTGNPDSISALIKVADRHYPGGGQRNGSTGFVHVIDATGGVPLDRHALPSRVAECGLAAADGRLIICCENGVMVALGK